jgi:hypothetical protein
MSKGLIALVAALAVSSLSGCGTIGKGKGKALRQWSKNRQPRPFTNRRLTLIV